MPLAICPVHGRSIFETLLCTRVTAKSSSILLCYNIMVDAMRSSGLLLSVGSRLMVVMILITLLMLCVFWGTTA
ncbi:hypothetical protein PSNIH1_09685 [Pantoea sp. PSNIH1]|nr:hypothetical protein PSNIH1_09685 [Pantoea sp. PSNIH1]